MQNFIKMFENSVRTRWNQPALSDFHISTETYGELALNIERWHLIWKEAGLKKGDKIAINARNCSHWIELFLSAISGGYVSVQLYNAFLPSDVQKLAVHSDSRILYTEKSLFKSMDFDKMPELIAAIDTESMEILACRNGFDQIYNEADKQLAKKYPESFCADNVDYSSFDMDDVCAIMYTSGSTGNPKGVMLTVKNFGWNVMVFTESIPYQGGVNYVSILPYAHIFGLTCDVVIPMSMGMHITALCKPPIAMNIEVVMKECKPKIFFAVPLVLGKFIEHSIGNEIKSEDGIKKLENYKEYPEYCNYLREKVLSSLGGNIEIFATGGAAIAPELESLLAFKINLPFITGYGMSECAPLLSIGKLGEYKAKSCGKVIRTLEARIDSADESNIPGEYQVKGDCVFVGYYKNPAATKAAFTEDGWFKTGDVGTIDKDKVLFLVGRCKNMLLSSNGQNIYPEEIEVILNSMPYISESIVIQRDNKIHALIVPDMTLADSNNIDSHTLHAIMEVNIKNLNNNLPAYSAVNSFELRFEPFSKTPKGSIRRFMYS